MFPDNAVTVDGEPSPQEKKAVTTNATSQPSTEPQLPAYANGGIEPMLNPTVCLVAPDVTPDAVVPIDPSDVPHLAITDPAPTTQTAPGQAPSVGSTEDSKKNVTVLQTILGKRTHGPEAPELSQESVHIPGITDVTPISEGNYNIMAAAMTPGVPMPPPEHNPNGINQMLSNVRRFLK